MIELKIIAAILSFQLGLLVYKTYIGFKYQRDLKALEDAHLVTVKRYEAKIAQMNSDLAAWKNKCNQLTENIREMNARLFTQATGKAK